MQVQAMGDDHWPTLAALELEAFGEGVAESAAVLRSHWLAAPDLCFVCLDGDTPLGFVLAHAWGSDAPPQLHQPLAPAECRGDILFLHDLVVGKAAAGKGVGARLVQRLLQAAAERALHRIMLVAVQGADSYWRKLGFVDVARKADASYGATAVVMERALRG